MVRAAAARGARSRCGTRRCGRCSSLAAAAAWTCWCAGERLAERLPLAALGADFVLTGSVGGFPSAAPGQITFAFDVARAAAAGRAAARAPHVVRRRRPACGPATRWPSRRGCGRRAARAIPAASTTSSGCSSTVTARRATCAPAPSTQRPAASSGRAWLRVSRASSPSASAPRARDADGVALLTALALGERFRFTRAALGGLSPHGHEPPRRRVGHARRVARRRRVRRAAPRLAAAAAPARELRPRGRRRREPARDGLLRRAHGLRRAGAALARHDRDRARGAREPPPRRAPRSSSRRRSSSCSSGIRSRRCRRRSGCRSSRSRSCSRSRRPGRWRTRRRDRLRRGARVALEFVRLQWWIGLALLPLTAWYFGEVSIVGPLVNLVAIPFFNLCLVPLTVLATLALSFDALARVGGAARARDWLRSPAARCAPARRRASCRSRPRTRAAAAVARARRGGARRRVRRLRRGAAGQPPGLARAAAARACRRCELPPHGTARVVVLDVGHGLAVLVETRAHGCCSMRGRRRARDSTAARRSCLPALAAERSPRSRSPHREPRRQRSRRRCRGHRRRLSATSTC